MLSTPPSSWPLKEARAILQRIDKKTPEKGFIAFASGYGPSGLPHIGTFGEAVRTSMVQKALQEISDIPSKFYVFSDDLDGLRKIPDNIPNPSSLQKYLEKPLTSIPDPFNKFDSFAAHNNALLQKFLDDFGFEYRFFSATMLYKNGFYDKMLLKVLDNYEKITETIIPHLGEERKATYSPFLPISPHSGKVLQVKIDRIDKNNKTICYRDIDTNRLIETEITSGKVKLQWKIDWPMRWAALDIDYEMSGKDLISSVRLGKKICRILGKKPPINFTYELFLDKSGEKISKSKGNGLTIDEWMRYGTKESLALFMYHNPGRAKRLYFDCIPKAIDEYLKLLRLYDKQDPSQRLHNPVSLIHRDKIPSYKDRPSFSMLLHLASAAACDSERILWQFIKRYDPSMQEGFDEILDEMVRKAINYYLDFVKPYKKFRKALPQEEKALKALAIGLEKNPDMSPENIQNLVYEIGQEFCFEPIKKWFDALYQILLGQNQGPKLGSFIHIFGIKHTAELIRQKIA